MHLLRYTNSDFINADKIQTIHINAISGRVFLSLDISTGEDREVHKDYIDSFLNHLQAFNDNITNVQRAYKELTEAK